jgi:hypothetical protein
VTTRLTQPQQRHVAAGLAHVDRLLLAVEQVAQATPSPFARERSDLSPDETRLLLSFVRLARGRMLAALDRLGIARPAPSVSARWSIETSLRFVDIALSELDPKGLAGYGALDSEAAEELRALTDELRSVIRRGGALVRELDPEELGQRVREVPGPPGQVLRALERLSREHGIPETRPLIAIAADRARAAALDVGVFGRVGAGKSSMINALVGTPVLPVGATPVTAVPVVLRRGPPGATVSFYEGDPRAVPLEGIGAYVTEDQNPQNRRGVRAVEVTVTTAPEGLRLLDTPGVGSLSASGPAQAYAWLPRCDLGLVLIQTGSPVGREELALVAGLSRVGIECLVLLSKSDLSSPDDLDRATAYVKAELNGAAAGPGSVDVRTMSTLPDHTAGLNAFRDYVLAPLARDRLRAARDALRARLHRLVALTGAALQNTDAGTPARDGTGPRLAAAEAVEHEVSRLSRAGPEVSTAAARALADAWSRGDDTRVAVRNAILRSTADGLEAVRSAVHQAATASPAPIPPSHRLPPLFEPEFLDRLPPFAPPRFAPGRRGPAVAARRLQPLAAPLGRALARYAERLRAWGLGLLDELAALSADPGSAAPVTLTGELVELDALIDRPDPGP